MSMVSMHRILIWAIALGAVAVPSHAADLTLGNGEKPVPDAVAEEIRAALVADSVILSAGDAPVWEFWFRAEVPLTSAPSDGAAGPDQLRPTTLLGVVTLHEEQRDFKDSIIEKGTYTMRYGQQPMDGNHLGTATHNHFVVLIPVKYDTKLEAEWDADAMADESTASSVAKHPMNLNLQPVPKGQAPALAEGDDDTKLIQVELDARAGESETPLRFGLVYEGTGHL